MMQLSAIRGVVLEELVLHLLRIVGYRVVDPGEEGTRRGHSGLEVQGRGEWHQIDALAAFDRTPAFMYPLRLMVEAKCYAHGRPTGIEIVRNAVGVLKDISENYVTYAPNTEGAAEVQVQRFNYHSAVFSTSGYTVGAQRYAIAHQVFLIQYQGVSLLSPVVEGLLDLRQEHVRDFDGRPDGERASQVLRDEVRQMLAGDGDVEWTQRSAFTDVGLAYMLEAVIRPSLQIRGSYFGMLQGRWPMHLLARVPLPAETFEGVDELPCRVYGRQSDRWSFSPVDFDDGDRRWFRLEFDLPEEVVGFVRAAREDPVALAGVKRRQFSFLDVAGSIGGVYRQVRLRLDEGWLDGYLNRIRNRRQQ